GALPCEPLHQKGTQRDERRDCDQLTAENHPVDIDGRAPADVAVSDNEHAGGPRSESEPDTGVLGAAADATAAAHDGRRDESDAVGLNDIAEDAPSCHRVLRAAEHELVSMGNLRCL